MQNKKKIAVSTILFITMSLISTVLFINQLYTYLIITGTLAIIFFFTLVSILLKKQDERSKYESNLKSMLKKFDSILVETSTVPDLDGKNIMLITNIEDMIDAAVEIRKPIYYKKEEDDCVFILLDNQDTCIYVLKLYEDMETAIEKFVKDRKQNIESLIEQAKDIREIKDIMNTNTNIDKAFEEEKEDTKDIEEDEEIL